jgi:hypothetical protein
MEPFRPPPELATFAKRWVPKDVNDRHRAQMLMDVQVFPEAKGSWVVQYANDRTRSIG